MNFFRRLLYVLVIALLLVPLATTNQDVDGPTRVFRDSLLDNMTGTWNLAGKILGRNANHLLEVEWVLNHQFLRIHEKDENSSANVAVPYEAMIMIGYDNASDRYVAHWNDVCGGRFSETLGYGTQAKDKSGKWTDFADLTLVRAKQT